MNEIVTESHEINTDVRTYQLTNLAKQNLLFTLTVSVMVLRMSKHIILPELT